jgi:hypothetical protein
VDNVECAIEMHVIEELMKMCVCEEHVVENIPKKSAIE